MNKLLLIITLYFIGCSELDCALVTNCEAEEQYKKEREEFYNDYYSSQLEELNRVKNEKCEIAYRLSNYVPKNYPIDTTIGIYVTDGIYISGAYRQANQFGVHGAIELYSVNNEVMEYNLIYKWHPMDTMFTTGYVNRIKIYPHRKQEIAINTSISDWLIELTSVEIVNTHKLCVKDSKGEWQYDTWSVRLEPEYIPIWEGNITVGYNNDYIRRSCEPNHACAGYIGGVSGIACSDGWISYSSGSGTCSWHGGIYK